MAYLLIFTSAFLTAIYLTLISRWLKERPLLSSSIVMAMAHFTAGAFLLPVWLSLKTLPLSSYAVPAFALPFAATVVLLVAARRMYYYSYSVSPVGEVAMFSALTPLYAMIAGQIVLHELPGPTVSLGITLICIGIYGYYLRPKPGMSLLSAAVQPFARIRSSTGLRLAFFSTLPPAFASVFQKEAMLHADPLGFITLQMLIIGTASLVWDAAVKAPHSFRERLRALPWQHYLLLGALLGSANVCFSFFLAGSLTAVAVALQRVSILFQVLLAAALLRETEGLIRHVLLCIMVMTGYILIAS